MAARDVLLSAGSYEFDQAHLLETPGTRTLIASIERATIASGTVVFDRPGYARALLHHAWQDYPGLRRVLGYWFDRLPAEVPSVDPRVLAERVFDLAQRNADGTLAVTVARKWATPRPANRSYQVKGEIRRNGAALQLLALAAVDQTIGRDVRRQMYQGAYGQRQSTAVRLLMAEVTAVFAPDYPAVALTRLKHLAVGAEPEVAQLIRPALEQAASAMKINDLVRALTSWLHGADHARATVLVDVITSTPIGDRLFEAGDGVLLSFWRSALLQLPAEQAVGLVQDRLHSTVPAAAGLPGLLISAAGDDLRCLGRLLSATSSAAGAGPSADLGARVRDRLDEIATHSSEDKETAPWSRG